MAEPIDQAGNEPKEGEDTGAVKESIVRHGDGKEFKISDIEEGKVTLIENDVFTKQNQDKADVIKSLEAKAKYVDNLELLTDKYPNFTKSLNTYIEKYEKGDFTDMADNTKAAEEILDGDTETPVDNTEVTALKEKIAELEGVVKDVAGWKDQTLRKKQDSDYKDLVKTKGTDLGISDNLQKYYYNEVSAEIVNQHKAGVNVKDKQVQEKIFNDVYESMKGDGIITESKDKLGGDGEPAADKESLKISKDDDRDTVLKKLKAKFGR